MQDEGIGERRHKKTRLPQTDKETRKNDRPSFDTLPQGQVVVRSQGLSLAHSLSSVVYSFS